MPSCAGIAAYGFCKLVVDRATHKMIGCHVVGERAVEITQVAAIVMTAGMRVDELARVPLSFPTYAEILGRVAGAITRQLNRQGGSADPGCHSGGPEAPSYEL